MTHDGAPSAGEVVRARLNSCFVPHTAAAVTAEEWEHGYSRSQAAYPAPWLREHKFWPHVGRVDNALGDRNLVCACPPIESY